MEAATTSTTHPASTTVGTSTHGASMHSDTGPAASHLKDDTGPLDPQPTKPSDELSEAEFLERQANEAKAALLQALSDVKAKLGEGANPVHWAKEYPWISMGVAAVAGFVGTAMLVPSREEQALAKLAAIERALHPPPPKPKADHDVDGHEDAKAYKAGSSSIWTVIVREVLGAIRPALVSMLTAGMAGKIAKPSQEEMQAAAASENIKEQTGQSQP